MSRKVGEINANGPMLINTSIQDLFDDPIEVQKTEQLEDETSFYSGTFDNDEEEDIVSTNPQDELDDNEQDESTSTVESEEEETDAEDSSDEASDEGDSSNDDFKDYSNAAILALSLKQLEPDLVTIDEINKDLDAEQLINVLKSSVEKQKETIKEELQTQYENVAVYIEEVLQGMNQQTLQASLYNKQIGDIELTGEETDEDLESLVKPWLLQRGTPETEIDDIVQVFKDKGTLYEKAQQSIQFHKEQELLILENHRRAREEYIQKEKEAKEESAKKIKQIINTGSAKGLALSRELETAIFKPTEIIEDVDQNGRKVVYKVPLVEKRYREFYQDPEQQVAFMQLLANNFDFTSLTTKAKSKVNKELLNIINNRTPSINRNSSAKTSYFSD